MPILVILALLVTAAAFAAEPCQVLREDAAKLVAAPAAERSAQIKNLTDAIGRYPLCFLDAATGALGLQRGLLELIQNFRTDKQPGASSGSEGGTSLVSRGVTAKTLSVAAEHGALTQSVNGQVVTFRGNLAGIPSVLVKRDVFPYCDPRLPRANQTGFCFDNSVLGHLRRVSFGVSFDASRNAQTVTGSTSTSGGAAGTAPSPATIPTVSFTASRRELSAVSARYEIWNRRDVSSKDYQQRWLDKLKAVSESTATAQALTKKFEPFFQKVELDSPATYEAWQKETREKLEAAVGQRADQIAALVFREFGVLAKRLVDERVVTPDELRGLRSAFAHFTFTQDEIIDFASNQPVITFEFTNNRPLAQNPISSFRFVFDLPARKGLSVAANFAFTIFDCLPGEAKPSVSRLRDVQLGVMAEQSLGNLLSFGPTTLSGAFYYQYQNNPAILNVDPAKPLPGITFIGLPPNARTVFAEKGKIKVGQVRLMFGSGNSVKFPVSVSYSNRTELINKPVWRAQVGVTYDFDALFMK